MNLRLVAQHVPSNILHSEAKRVGEMAGLVIHDVQKAAIIHVFLRESSSDVSLGLDVLQMTVFRFGGHDVPYT